MPSEYIARSTVQFHWMIDGHAGNVASCGAIISVRGKKYVVTVLHGQDDDSGMLCHERATNQTYFYLPHRYPVIAFKSPDNNDGKRGDPVVDFTFFPLPNDYAPIRNIGSICYTINDVPVSFSAGLPMTASYSVGGAVPVLNSGTSTLAEFKTVEGIAPDTAGPRPYLYFSTTGSSIEPGFDYNGLSGAPIINEQGEAVALLCGSCDEDDSGQKVPRRFWGVDIAHAFGLIVSIEDGFIPNFRDLPDDLRLNMAQRAVESYFYDDTEIRDMFWK